MLFLIFYRETPTPFLVKLYLFFRNTSKVNMSSLPDNKKRTLCQGHYGKFPYFLFNEINSMQRNSRLISWHGLTNISFATESESLIARFNAISQTMKPFVGKASKARNHTLLRVQRIHFSECADHEVLIIPNILRKSFEHDNWKRFMRLQQHCLCAEEWCRSLTCLAVYPGHLLPVDSDTLIRVS